MSTIDDQDRYAVDKVRKTSLMQFKIRINKKDTLKLVVKEFDYLLPDAKDVNLHLYIKELSTILEFN